MTPEPEIHQRDRDLHPPAYALVWDGTPDKLHQHDVING
jgi:hypothetical protein